jgi:5-methylthioribose kinase
MCNILKFYNFQMSIYTNLAHLANLETTTQNSELEAFRKMIVEENKRVVDEKLNYYGIMTFDKSQALGKEKLNYFLNLLLNLFRLQAFWYIKIWKSAEK